ncbi:hypothetical protein ABZ915_41060 [Streptomyces sp. NPDC046915]|uniref:hypothetical protein n=1 Tax=Streptomyces sp. NPDC046915 TaxID=3155257 RepID=UPI0033F1F691
MRPRELRRGLAGAAGRAGIGRGLPERFCLCGGWHVKGRDFVAVRERGPAARPLLGRPPPAARRPLLRLGRSPSTLAPPTVRARPPVSRPGAAVRVRGRILGLLAGRP